MGLREKKKEKTRNAILEYSKDRFIKYGYKKVTTSEIAKTLEIGEGTIFNYFNSKGQLFIECLIDTVVIDDYCFNATEISDENDVVEEIMNFIDVYLKSLIKLDRILLREYISVLYDVNNRLKSNEGVMPFIDEFFLEQLNKFLSSLKNLKSFDNNMDESNLSFCVMSCIVSQFTLYVNDENFTFEGMISQLEKHVALILHGNILSKK